MFFSYLHEYRGSFAFALVEGELCCYTEKTLTEVTPGVSNRYYFKHDYIIHFITTLFCYH